MKTKNPKKQNAETGVPGGGAGRRDEVGRSGVYPMSGPHPKGDAPIIPEPGWGQGERGAQGYEDSGSSELWFSGGKPQQCNDLMTTNPVCCSASDIVQRAAELLRDQDVGSIPVVENTENNKLVGMLTDRDIVVRMVAKGGRRTTKVEEIMTRDVVTCAPEDSIQKCVELMESKQIRRIPITDQKGEIVGIIAQADIAVRMRQPQQTGEVVQEISRPKAA